MALAYKYLKKESDVKGYIAEKRLYLDADGKVTDDPEKGAHLLAAAGRTIPEAKARELGLIHAAESKSDADPDPEPEDPKPVDFSRANKATLQAEAEKRGLDTSGTNKEIRERIEAHDADPDPEPEE